ncbi:hypothetical protein IT401_02565 [Candidatus Nomurabacteria bacterium]|nr:hypothetical protein [Candidatus Nomurabacteria bacterium]
MRNPTTRVFVLGIGTLALAAGGYALFAPSHTHTRAKISRFVEANIKVIDPSELISSNTAEPVWLQLLAHPRTILDTSNREELAGSTIITATNRIRSKYGLSPLVENTALDISAQKKVVDMFTRQYFDHVSPDGKAVSDLGEEAGYRYIIMGENLALGDFRNTEDLLQAWMESEGHRANILHTSYREIGAFAMRSSFEGKTVWIAVQHFGVNRAVCPSIDIALKENIDAMNDQLSQQESAIEALSKILSNNLDNEEIYEKSVVEFNQRIGAYNQMRDISKEMVRTYNQQVSAFNTCLGNYQ